MLHKILCSQIIKPSLFVLLLLFGSCWQTEIQPSWSVFYKQHGSYSSPRLSDLNSDGVLDIVIGAGLNIYENVKYGVLALDGKDGHLLWSHSSSDQMVGSASFLDINDDDTKDVIIGGRNHNLFAIDGKSGEEIWKYELTSEEFDAFGLARFNFYNSQVIEDCNNDGIEDILTVNGGNIVALHGNSNQRFPGVLMIISGKNGEIIAADIMPDKQESYMSPVVYTNCLGERQILFGTGGETFNGGIFKIPLKSLLEGDISEAQQIVYSDNGHGYIVPPILADLNLDHIPDLILTNHGGYIEAINGQDFSILWRLEVEGNEFNSMPAIGYFNEDANPDLFVHGAKGNWPQNIGTNQLFIDGTSGKVIKRYDLGCIGFSSPVAYDFDKDGLDEVLLSLNEYSCGSMGTLNSKTSIYHFDLNDATLWNESKTDGKNIACSPWIGDMDNNNLLDIVYVKCVNTPLPGDFFGLQINKDETPIAIHDELKWGAYMGSNYDAIFDACRE